MFTHTRCNAGEVPNTYKIMKIVFSKVKMETDASVAEGTAIHGATIMLFMAVPRAIKRPNPVLETVLRSIPGTGVYLGLVFRY